MAEVEIKGLKELKQGLRDVQLGLPKMLAAGFKSIAANIADKVRTNMPGKLAKTVKASGTQKGGAIKYVNAKVSGPWNTDKNVTGWWDFGGDVGPGKKITVRPFAKGGRFLYPTIAKERHNTIKAVDNLIEGLAKRAGFEQRGHIDG